MTAATVALATALVAAQSDQPNLTPTAVPAGHLLFVQSISAVATPSGGILAATAGMADQAAQLFDLVSGRLIRTLRGTRGLVLGVSLDAQARWMLRGGSDATASIVDTVSGRELAV